MFAKTYETCFTVFKRISIVDTISNKSVITCDKMDVA